MTAEQEKKVTAKDMETHLKSKYSYPEWVFLPQVRSSTGSADRIADGMAFNMYRSTGYEIIGFEIKVSRSDWLSELKSMHKSNEIMTYCDKWFLVVSDINIVKEGELPKNWGLLVLKDGKLVQKTRPTPHKPSRMPMSFIASILRRSGDEVTRIRTEYVRKEDIADQVEAARKRGYDEARGYNGRQTEENLKQLQGWVDEFEKASGIHMRTWTGIDYPKSLGMYVKFAMELSESTLEYKTRDIETGISSLQKALADIKKIKTSLKTRTDEDRFKQEVLNDPPTEEKVCEFCQGTGEVSKMEPVYPGEPHMADTGTEKCVCQLTDTE